MMGNNAIELSYTNLFLLRKDLAKTIQSIDRLNYHLSRCKKASDTVKLTLLITVKIAYAVIITSTINDLYKEMMGFVLREYRKQ